MKIQGPIVVVEGTMYIERERGERERESGNHGIVMNDGSSIMNSLRAANIMLNGWSQQLQ